MRVLASDNSSYAWFLVISSRGMCYVSSQEYNRLIEHLEYHI